MKTLSSMLAIAVATTMVIGVTPSFAQPGARQCLIDYMNSEVAKRDPRDVHEVISVNVKCTGPVAAQKWTYRHKKTLQIHYGLDAAFPRDILQQCGNPCQ